MRNPYKVAFWVLFAAFGTVCFPLGCAVACLQLTDRTGESGRFTSPNGETDAVLVTVIGGGAAGYVNENLYLVPTGTPFEEAARSGSVLGIADVEDYSGGYFRPRWRNNRVLEVRYDKAALLNFSNRATIEGKGGEGYVVEVRLVPPENGFALPYYYYRDPEQEIDGPR